MNVKHIWSVLCKESIINQEDNVISLHGVLEEISSLLTPVGKEFKKQEKIIIPFNYEIVSYWIKDLDRDIKMDVKVKIIDPKGKELSEAVNSSVFPKESKRLRTRMKIQGLPVTENGRYIFTISLKTDNEKDYKQVSMLPLDIKFKIQPQKTSVS